MLHPSGLPENLRSLDRTLVMGVLNLTPDSFSDGGRFNDPTIATNHALQMIQDGADIIDIEHQRTFSHLPPRCAELSVVLETRGQQHVERILQLLQREGFPARAT